MEPMALGSPSSPANPNCHLPMFLMGQMTETPPPRSTLSPTKIGGGRSLAFGQSPNNSPKDQTPHRQSAFRNPLSPISAAGSSSQGMNSGGGCGGGGGPPTQGLFDSLVSTDRSLLEGASPRIGAPGLHRQITSPFAAQPPAHNQTLSDSIYNHASSTTTPVRRQSIIPGPKHNFTASSFHGTPSGMFLGQSSAADCWVTVFGFPQSATSMILSHFSQCGTIVDKVQPQNSGNWLHLRYTNKMECDRALNYNEKILNNYFMVGVTRCKDPVVLEWEPRDDAENSSFVGNQTPRNVSFTTSLRPLAHVAYKTVQSPSDVVASPTAPSKSSGILDRAMDFFLGW